MSRDVKPTIQMRLYVLLICLVSVPFLVKGQKMNSSDSLIKGYDDIYITLKQNYPLFAYRSYYNLDTAYLAHRAKAIASRTEKALFESCCAMIKGLEDFHVRLSNKEGTCFALSGTEWHRTFSNDSLQHMFWKNSDATLYKAGFVPLQSRFYDEGHPMVRFTRSKELAYLNLSRFEIQSDKNFGRLDSVRLTNFMDSLVLQFKGAKALIVDMRSCMGGEDVIGEIIASRLTRKLLCYARTIKYANAYDSMPPKSSYIYPKGKKQLQLPIFVLTNQVTRSAAECFVLMLKQLPEVYLIGEPTWGAFSSTRKKKLQNGWKLTMPQERIETCQGEVFEGRGIPVDYRVKNCWNDILSEQDPVISKALDFAQSITK